MKKLGFIAIAMVTLLATLGIGFSMWSQTVTVNGIVNTGSLGFTLGSPTGTWVYKDVNNGLPITVEGAVGTGTVVLPGVAQAVQLPVNVPVAGVYPGTTAGDSIILVGAAYTYGITSTGASMAWFNIFPTAPFNGVPNWCADLSLTNTSTIPVKFHAVVSSSSGIGNLTGPVITFTGPAPVGGGPAPEIALEGYQLEPGTAPLHINVCIGVPDNNNDMNIHSGTFTITIQMVQWNEFSGTAIQQ
jgi:hypothetical protein